MRLRDDSTDIHQAYHSFLYEAHSAIHNTVPVCIITVKSATPSYISPLLKSLLTKRNKLPIPEITENRTIYIPTENRFTGLRKLNYSSSSSSSSRYWMQDDHPLYPDRCTRAAALLCSQTEQAGSSTLRPVLLQTPSHLARTRLFLVFLIVIPIHRHYMFQSRKVSHNVHACIVSITSTTLPKGHVTRGSTGIWATRRLGDRRLGDNFFPKWSFGRHEIGRLGDKSKSLHLRQWQSVGRSVHAIIRSY